jgi:CopG family nickel-responsive transcriptional regulator
MQRITISLEDELSDALDAFLKARGYRSRSEGIRDLVRGAMTRPSEVGARHTHCVANLSYIYNHRVRTLASKLADFQHAHHDLIASTTLIHLDHDNSLESIMLRGQTQAVLAFSDLIGAERGVRSHHINLVGVAPHDHHDHVHDHHHSGHEHLSPIN